MCPVVARGEYGHNGFVLRVHSLAGILVMLGVVCASCTPPRLPSDEVLQKAASASRTLESANVVAEINARLRLGEGTLAVNGDLHGTIASGGQQVHIRSQFTAETDSAEPLHVSGDVELISVGEGSVFVKVHALRVEGDGSPLSEDMLRQLQGTWWRLPVAAEGTNDAPVTPRPELLRAQSRVVRVTHQHGFATVDGKHAYHYGVAIDPEKFLAYLRQLHEDGGDAFDEQGATLFAQQFVATGELWIDAAEFFLRRIRWHIVPSEGDAFVVDVDATLRDHNAASPIAPPEGAQDFRLDQLLGAPTVPSDSSPVAPFVLPHE